LCYDSAGFSQAGKFKANQFLASDRYDEVVRLALKLIELAPKEMRKAAQEMGKPIQQGISTSDLSGLNFRDHYSISGKGSTLQFFPSEYVDHFRIDILYYF